MSHDPFAHDDAAYVLGALGPDERRAFEEHLEHCPDCTRAVRDLAGMPGLLTRLDESAYAGPEGAPQVPDTLLPVLLRRVRRQRWRGRLLAGAGAVVAAVLAVVVGVSVLGEADGDAPPPATAGLEMTPVDQDELTATVAMEQVAWGTKMHLACTEAEEEPDAADHSYALVVTTTDGRRQQVATWRGLPGRTAQLDAATDAFTDEIASVDVVVADTGEPVLTLRRS